MKTKSALIVTLIFILAASASAQIKLGIRGGLNASRLKSSTEFLTPDPTPLNNYKITVPNYMMIGYHVGLIGQIQLFNFFIQPEALYTVTRNDINVYDLNSATPDNADNITQRLNRIDVPILVGFKLKDFKMEIGPVVTFLVSDDSDLQQITQYDLKLNKASAGFQAGIGLDFRHLCLDLKYEGSLSKLSDGINIGNNERIGFDSRISQVILSAGIYF
ncbi:MAG TPA: porin family protein [Bacteroidales bacterium]|nr:porin family protein [Bacteroidales bacterium]